MRAPYDIANVFRGQTLNGSLSVGRDLPLTGESWERMRMVLKLTTTHASEDYPFELAGYYFLRNIVLQADGRQIVQAPGGALYWLNSVARGKAPVHENVLAAAATYDYIIDIPFVFPQFNRRREDFMFDSGAYSNVELQITAGTIADIFATVSTAAVTATLDLSIYRTKAGKSLKGKPVYEPYIKALEQIATSAKPYWDIENNPNLDLVALIALSGGSAAAPWFQNGGSNGAWGGVDALDRVYLDNGDGYDLQNVPVENFRESRNDLLPYLNAFGGGTHVQSPTLTGLQTHVFTKDGSVRSAYPTKGPNYNRTKLRFGSESATGSNYSDLLLVAGRRVGYGVAGKQVRF